MADGGDVQQQPSFDSLPEDSPPTPTPTPSSPSNFDSMKEDFDSLPEDKESPDLGQHLLAGAEGVAQGVLGPAATYLETSPLLKKAAFTGAGGPLGSFLADQYNPTTDELAARSELPAHGAGEAMGLLGSILTGTGEAGLIAKGAKALVPEATSILGKIGAGALKGALETSALQSGNEISDYMLGKGDPEAPLAGALSHIGAAGLFGGITGGAFGGIGQGIKAISESKLGSNISKLLAGVGAANAVARVGETNPELAKVLDIGSEDPWFKRGMTLNEKIPDYLTKSILDPLAAKIGENYGGMYGGVTAATAMHRVLIPYLEKLVGRSLPDTVNKWVTPAALKLFSNGASGPELLDGIEHAVNVGTGLNKINNTVNSLFKAGSIVAAPPAGDYAREKLRKFISNGEYQKQIDAANAQANQQQPAPQFASGGEILPTEAPKTVLDGTDSLAKHFPVQNTLLNAARGRINNYLSATKPTPTPGKLAFDKAPNDVMKEKEYNNALDIANSPLSVLNHVKNNTLTLGHLSHLNAMYPEVYNQLSKKITEKVSEHQLKGKDIPYKLRQGLGLFLGSPLDSTMVPAGIQAAQSTFLNRNQTQGGAPQKAPASSSVKGMDKLPQQYRTPTEARDSRAQRSK